MWVKAFNRDDEKALRRCIADEGGDITYLKDTMSARERDEIFLMQRGQLETASENSFWELSCRLLRLLTTSWLLDNTTVLAVFPILIRQGNTGCGLNVDCQCKRPRPRIWFYECTKYPRRNTMLKDCRQNDLVSFIIGGFVRLMHILPSLRLNGYRDHLSPPCRVDLCCCHWESQQVCVCAGGRYLKVVDHTMHQLAGGKYSLKGILGTDTTRS